jgi:hypothetical protein
MRPSEAAALLLMQTYGKNAPLVVSDYLSAFPEGSRVLKDLEIYAGIHRPTPVSDGPEMLQRMEGRKEVFGWIRMICSLSPADVEQPKIGDDDDIGE